MMGQGSADYFMDDVIIVLEVVLELVNRDPAESRLCQHVSGFLAAPHGVEPFASDTSCLTCCCYIKGPRATKVVNCA